MLRLDQSWLGKPGRGVLSLLTLGLLTVGLWVDLFTLPRQVRAVNARRLAEAQGQLAVAHRAQLAAEASLTAQRVAPTTSELTDGAARPGRRVSRDGQCVGPPLGRSLAYSNRAWPARPFPSLAERTGIDVLRPFTRARSNRTNGGRLRSSWWGLLAVLCLLAGSSLVSASGSTPPRAAVSATAATCRITPVVPADVVRGGTPNILLQVTFVTAGTCTPGQLAGSQFFLYGYGANPDVVFGYHSGPRPVELVIPLSDLSNVYQVQPNRDLPAGVVGGTSLTTRLRIGTILQVRYTVSHGRSIEHWCFVDVGLTPISTRIYLQMNTQHGGSFGPWHTVRTYHTDRQGQVSFPTPKTGGNPVHTFRVAIPGTNYREPANEGA